MAWVWPRRVGRSSSTADSERAPRCPLALESDPHRTSSWVRCSAVCWVQYLTPAERLSITIQNRHSRVHTSRSDDLLIVANKAHTTSHGILVEITFPKRTVSTFLTLRNIFWTTRNEANLLAHIIREIEHGLSQLSEFALGEQTRDLKVHKHWK